jgi:hypothetical protein
MPDADRDTKSYLAKVRLDTPPAGLRSGMTAEVNIVVTEHDGEPAIARAVVREQAIEHHCGIALLAMRLWCVNRSNGIDICITNNVVAVV